MNTYRIGVTGPASQVHLVVAILHRTLAPYRFEIVGRVDTSLVEPTVSDWGLTWETLCRVLNVPMHTALQHCRGELSWGMRLSGQLNGFVPFGDLGLGIAQHELPQGIFRFLANSSSHRFEDFSVAAQAAKHNRLQRPQSAKSEWRHTLQYGAILNTQAMIQWLEVLNRGFGISILTGHGAENLDGNPSSLPECDLHIDLSYVSEDRSTTRWQEMVETGEVRPFQELRVNSDSVEIDYFNQGQCYRYQSPLPQEIAPWQGAVKWHGRNLSIHMPTGGLMGVGNHLCFEAIWRLLDVLCLDENARQHQQAYQQHMDLFIAEQWDFLIALFGAGSEYSAQIELFRAAGRLMTAQTDAIRPVQWYGVFAALQCYPQQHSVALSSTSDQQLSKILTTLSTHISNWVEHMPEYHLERDGWLSSQQSGAVQ